MISQSFQINHLLPFLFKECRISVLPVPVYPPRILRLKDCSKPYYIIAESFVPLFNNINFLKTIFDKMIGKSITFIPRQQCIATSLLDAIATDLVTKSFSLVSHIQNQFR
jgi:hypothetical protein